MAQSGQGGGDTPRGGPVTLVGGGPVPEGALGWAVGHTGRIVAADGGAGTVLLSGHRPDAVIGDMDSIDARTAAALDESRLDHVAEQDSTDFEKCLARVDAPWVIGLGFLGARLDHTLAALSVLSRRGPPCLLVGEHDVVFHLTGDVALDLPVGSRLSLFPMGPVTGRSTGLRWPIDGIGFAPAGAIGTSNEVTGPVRIQMDGPGMVVLLPAEARDVALAAVSAEGERQGEAAL